MNTKLLHTRHIKIHIVFNSFFPCHWWTSRWCCRRLVCGLGRSLRSTPTTIRISLCACASHFIQLKLELLIVLVWWKIKFWWMNICIPLEILRLEFRNLFINIFRILLIALTSCYLHISRTGQTIVEDFWCNFHWFSLQLWGYIYISSSENARKAPFWWVWGRACCQVWAPDAPSGWRERWSQSSPPSGWTGPSVVETQNLEVSKNSNLTSFVERNLKTQPKETLELVHLIV